MRPRVGTDQVAIWVLRPLPVGYHSTALLLLEKIRHDSISGSSLNADMNNHHILVPDNLYR